MSHPPLCELGKEGRKYRCGRNLALDECKSHKNLGRLQAAGRIKAAAWEPGKP